MGTGDDQVAIASSSVGAEITSITTDGNDRVLIQDSQVRNHIRIDTGRNEDTARVFNVSANSVSIEVGEGHDGVSVASLVMPGSLNVSAGLGNDVVLVNTVGGIDVVADTAGGSDRLEANFLQLRGSAVLVTGAGDDFLFVDANNGVGSSIARDLIANAGAGANTVIIGNFPTATPPVAVTTVNGNIAVYGGERSDFVRITNVTGARNVTIDTGSANDQVVLDRLSVVDQTFCTTCE